MKSFLRDNPTIAFGLGLPLLLVVAFLLVSGLPSLFVAPPQYDVIYATEYRNYQNNIQILVVDEKIQITHQGSTPNNQRPRLWRYNAKTGAVKEIAFILPPAPALAKNSPPGPAEDPKISMIDVPDLAGLKIDSSSIAPDGYEFNSGSNRYSRGVFDGLFYSSRRYNQAALIKNGRKIRLPNAVDRYYGNNTQFVGWVTSP